MMHSNSVSNSVAAEEALVVDVQVFLHSLMEEKGLSRAELARLMKVSRARVTQLFSDDCENLTVRLLARAAHAMGETVHLDCDLFQATRARTLRERIVLNKKASSNVVSLWSEEKEGDVNLTLRCTSDSRLRSFISHASESIREAA